MFRQLLQFVVMSLAGLTVVPKDAAPERPNVILIMTDDQGFGDLGCHGNPVLKTPHIDRLAAESVQLTNFHVHTFCSPTRAALMSGLHPWRTGVTRTTNRQDILRTDVPTMADYFRASGYRTGMFGKWHIGDGYTYSPLYRGFEETVTFEGGGIGVLANHWKNTQWNDTYLHNGEPTAYEGYATDVLFEEAMRFVKECGSDSPFFVYLPTFAPHRPWHLPKKWADEYAGKVETKLAYFYGAISRIDYNVGRLRDFLERQGLQKDTLLIFTTDNGSSSAEARAFFNAGHRGGKGSLEEHGHRVPCFVHWPRAGLDRKRAVPALTVHMDWLPTFVDLCHLKKPDRPGLPLDGVSMASLLLREEDAADQKWSDRMYALSNSKGRVVMKQHWRLIGRTLTNLKDDPLQRENVANKHPEMVAELEKHYHDCRNCVGQTPWRSNRPIYAGGSAEEFVTFRTAKFYTQGHILSGKGPKPTLPVHFLRGGDYEFEFRRWPRELNQPLDSAITVEPDEVLSLFGRPVYVNGGGSKGRSLPIRGVKLQVGEAVYHSKAIPEQAAIILKVKADKGPISVRAVFLDEDGNEIAMPYFTYIRRVVKQ